MKIKEVIIYCNPQAKCPALEYIHALNLHGQIQFFHKIAALRLGIFNECISFDSNLCAVRLHEKDKEMALYFGKGRSSIVLLAAGDTKKYETDSKKAVLYWKDYQTRKEQDVLFIEELYRKLQSKEFAIAYLKATIVDPEVKVFIVALKDVLQSHLIDTSDISEKTALNTTNLARLLAKKNAEKILTLPDILVALELYLAVHPIKKNI